MVETQKSNNDKNFTLHLFIRREQDGHFLVHKKLFHWQHEILIQKIVGMG
jgi:hypothetical protein